MKPTDADVKMFAALNGEVGKQLIDYLNRLNAYVCDSRTWADGEDKAHANKTAKVISDYLISKIHKPSMGAKSAYPYT